MIKPYYFRTQVQIAGIDEDCIQALMYFLWGTPFRKPRPDEAVAYECDLQWLRAMVGRPVDIKLELAPVEGL